MYKLLFHQSPSNAKSFAKFKLSLGLRTQSNASRALAKSRVEKVTQSVLAKAFRGELVPTEAELAETEGRDYETAAALLARIRREPRRLTANVIPPPAQSNQPADKRAARERSSGHD